MSQAKANFVYAVGLLLFILPHAPWIGYLTAGFLVTIYLLTQILARYAVPGKIYFRIATNVYEGYTIMCVDIMLMFSHVLISCSFGFYIMASMFLVAHLLGLNLYRNAVTYFKTPKIH